MRGRPALKTTLLARELRRNQTGVERRLWQALRARGFAAAKFRRQLAIGRHIVDLACPSHMLIVELDGGQHATQASCDEMRSCALAAHGYRVTRFWNNDVSDNLPGVMGTIESALVDPSPQPSPRSRGARGQDDNAFSYPHPRQGERAG
ncbi:MAG: endonuclease domain-containing protein [Stellaceae bacterium]